jgi:Fic family protein
LKRKDFARNAPGEIRASPDGVDSFVPSPLPPAINYSPSLVQQLEQAGRSLGELAALGRLLPNALLLIRPFLKREAVLSSRIEGTVTRLDQLLLFEAQPDSGGEENADVHEVLNYVRALDFGLDRLKQGMPLSLRLLREIHGQLMEGVRGSEKRPGEFRRCAVMIGRPGQSYEQARFVPPHHTLMKGVLHGFELFLHASRELPLVVQLALMHYQFQAIHPFMDGNGRMGRLLITLLLCERGVLTEPLLYLSAYFEKHNDAYRDHLLAISQRAAWEEWIAFFAVGIAEQSEDAVRRARLLLELQQQYRERMQKASQSSSVLKLVDRLFTSPFVTITGVAGLLNVTHRAATKNVEKLVEQQILQVTDPSRKTRRVYYAREIVELLNRPSM